MSTTLHWAALALYLCAALIYLGFVLWQRPKLHLAGRMVLWAGFSLHTLALGFAWHDLGVFPAVSLRQSFDLFSWAVMGASLMINLRLGIMVLGALSAPLASLLLLISSVLPASPTPPSPLLNSLWVSFHVVTAFLGYGLLALNCCGSLLYLVQERQIRKKSLGPVFSRLPSLSRIEELSQNAMFIGFCFMTVGMMSGAVYAQIALGSYWHWDPKEVWGLITWLLYAALIHTRVIQGWRGRRGARFSLAAFGLLMFSFLIVGLFFSGYHSFDSLIGIQGQPS